MIEIKIKGWKHINHDTIMINNIIKTKLKNLGIEFQSKVQDGVIVFEKNKENKYFWSNKTNKVVMSKDDKRIAALGRNYLETKRLTEAQYNGMLDALLGTLDNLQIEANVSMEDKLWRNKLTVIKDNIFKPNKFAETL